MSAACHLGISFQEEKLAVLWKSLFTGAGEGDVALVA